jgi:hypothetical protein
MSNLSDMPNTEKVYIVFRGVPSVFYIGSDKSSGYNALKDAEENAKDKTEQTQETHSILCVPKESVEIALAAIYHGVVIHSMEEAIAHEDRED